MRTPTHIAFGMGSGSVMASFYANSTSVQWGLNGLTLAAGGTVLVGALCPDLDHPRAPLARFLPFIARPLSRRWPHRTLMHSLLGLSLCTLVVYGILQVGLWITAMLHIDLNDHSGTLTGLFSFAYASHLSLDTCTRHGIRWLYPLIPNAFGYPSVDHYRLITGDKRAEWSVTGISIGIFLWSMPVTISGADTTLNNLIGTFEPLRDIYVHTVDQEVLLVFEGYTPQDKSPIAGQGIIVDVTAGTFLCYWENRVWTIGEEASEIFLLRGQCLAQPMAPRIETVSVRGSLLSDIWTETNNVLISGQLVATRNFTINPETTSPSITSTKKGLTLTYASPEELTTLQVTPEQKTVSVSDVQQGLTSARGIIDSLVTVRSELPASAMYERERLFTKIKVQREGISKLEKEVATQSAWPHEVRWSGRLMVRHMPTLEK